MTSTNPIDEYIGKTGSGAKRQSVCRAGYDPEGAFRSRKADFDDKRRNVR